jgi:16S rRNA (uracil1498-N3)-methyltransferase
MLPRVNGWGGQFDARELVRDVVWAIGPEGGFTDLEVQLAQAAGWRTVAFGPRVLRVETAALAAAAWSVLFA